MSFKIKYFVFSLMCLLMAVGQSALAQLVTDEDELEIDQYYSFSSGTAFSAEDIGIYNVDVLAGNNEGGVVLGRNYDSNVSEVKRILPLGNGVLDSVTDIPEWTGEAPWLLDSWEATGTHLLEGELWAIYTTDNYYVALEVTELTDTGFKFSYKYQSDGSRFFEAPSPQTGTATLSHTAGQWEYFDFSNGTPSDETDVDNYFADIRGTSNEGVNFGNESAPQISGKRVIFLGTGDLEYPVNIPEWNDEFPWMNVSWELSFMPVEEGQLWGVYTRENNYTLMKITEVPESFGSEFSFEYIYQPDGSNIFGEPTTPAAFEIESGDGQTIGEKSVLENMLTVRITDESGSGVPNVMVHFSVKERPEELLLSGYFLNNNDLVYTNENGIAAVNFHTGDALGQYIIEANLLSYSEVTPLEFTINVSDKPVSPSSLGAGEVDGDILLDWVTVPGAETYNVYRALFPGEFNDAQLIINMPDTTYTDEDSEPGQVYTYWVTSIDGGGSESDPSTFLTVTTWMDFVGGGTSEDPYLITNVIQLQQIEHDLTAYYSLANDIDASSTKEWNGGLGFRPLGDGRNQFTGTLNGQGYLIHELYINRTEQSNVGLFNTIQSNGLVTNLAMVNTDISGWVSVGGIAASLNGGEINKSYVTGNISGTFSSIGGVVGTCFANSAISETFSMAKVSGPMIVGGLVGIADCLIENSYSSGIVSADEKTGSLIGSAGQGTTLSVVNSYAGGMVTGGQYTAGFMGGDLTGFNITNSYWNMASTGQEDGVAAGEGDGLTGLTDPQMKQQGSYHDWDFDTIWMIYEETTYPLLRFQYETEEEPATPEHIVILSGDEQTGEAGEALDEPFKVQVTDADNNGLDDVDVFFNIETIPGDAQTAALLETLVVTSDGGYAESTLTLGEIAGTYTVSVNVNGVDQVIFTATAITETSINSETRPTVYSIDQNYPNPFNPSTIISYQLPENNHIRIEVYDVVGRKVAVLVDEMKTAGHHQAMFNAQNLSGGVYIYRLSTDSGDQFTKKMLLLK
ncbi:MAG: T9SS type A sorting domain-containing protein [Balneolales bacterium]